MILGRTNRIKFALRSGSWPGCVWFKLRYHFPFQLPLMSPLVYQSFVSGNIVLDAKNKFNIILLPYLWSPECNDLVIIRVKLVWSQFIAIKSFMCVSTTVVNSSIEYKTTNRNNNKGEWDLLTGGNWQKWKRVFLIFPCHEIYRDEAVGLKSCKNNWKITIFVKMWNLGQNRENLIFCQ